MYKQPRILRLQNIETADLVMKKFEMTVIKWL